MDSKRRFKLRGQSVPDSPKAPRRIKKTNMDGDEINLVPFYEVQGEGYTASSAAGFIRQELNRQGFNRENGAWAVRAVCDALGYVRGTTIEQMVYREMGIINDPTPETEEVPRNADDIEIDYNRFIHIRRQEMRRLDEIEAWMAEFGQQGFDLTTITEATLNAVFDATRVARNSVMADSIRAAVETHRPTPIMFNPAQGSVTIPDGTAANMSVESNAERILQNMIRQGMTRDAMHQTRANIHSARDSWLGDTQAIALDQALELRIDLYWTVAALAVRPEARTPQEMMRAILHSQNSGQSPRWPTPPIERAPRQVNPVVRNPNRPRAAPRGGVAPAQFQRTDSSLTRRLNQFIEESNDLRDQNIRLTNAGQAADAQMVLEQFHNYRQDIGSFPETGDWRRAAQIQYDACWNAMFENRMRYDSSRGVRRISRRKP